MLKALSAFLTEPRYRKVHFTVISVALLLHLFLHYATYIPALREPLGSLPYFRLHVLHEAEFLLIVVYATLVYRLKGGLIAVVATGLTSIPFILTPYIFGREARVDEIRDMTIIVVFILLMGALMAVLYEAVAREKERRLALAGEVEKANAQLSVKNGELAEANDKLTSANNQLTGLNQMIQRRLNTLYDQLDNVLKGEKKQLEAVSDGGPNPLKERFHRFIEKVNTLVLASDEEPPASRQG